MYKAKKFYTWLYRVKTAERVCYIVAIIAAFCCYKNTELLRRIFVTNATRSIPGVALVIICFSLIQWYLDDKHKKALE